VLRRQTPKRPHLNNTDRFLFVWLYRWFPSILEALAIVRPETIIRWHRSGFRAYWRWRSCNRVGRPKISVDLRKLIGEMSCANPLWGAPHIHGELLKLGFEVAQSTVARYMCRRSRPPSQSWRTFLNNHVDGTFCSADDHVPGPLLSCRPSAWTTSLGVVWSDRKSDCGVDLAPDYRGITLTGRPASLNVATVDCATLNPSLSSFRDARRIIPSRGVLAVSQSKQGTRIRYQVQVGFRGRPLYRVVSATIGTLVDRLVRRKPRMVRRRHYCARDANGRRHFAEWSNQRWHASHLGVARYRKPRIRPIA
jgi:hypothetical protein